MTFRVAEGAVAEQEATERVAVLGGSEEERKTMMAERVAPPTAPPTAEIFAPAFL
jgi:hypothetical protein